MKGQDAEQPMMILVAGPYRSGTGDDPAKLAANVAAMDRMVEVARERGLAVYHELRNVPGCAGAVVNR